MTKMTQTTIPITGGMTEKAFPKSEHMLKNNVYYLTAVKTTANKNKFNRYKSLMDYIFCETWPIPWKIRCFRHYKGAVGLLTESNIQSYEILWYDIIMSRLLFKLCFNYVSNEYTWHKVIGIMREYVRNWRGLYGRPYFGTGRVLDKNR